MKKLIIFGILNILCGCGSANEPQGSTNKSVDNLKTISPTYIITGQSNAQGLLNAALGEYREQVLTTIFQPTKDNIVGFAVGGTSVNFWLNSNNNAPLLYLVSKYCTSNTILVWDQGESDLYPQDGIPKSDGSGGTFDTQGSSYSYSDRMKQFFTILTNTCPTLKFIIVQIRYSQPITDPNVQNVVQTEINFGYPLYNYDGFPSPDGLHSYLAGYTAILNKILSDNQ